MTYALGTFSLQLPHMIKCSDCLSEAASRYM